MEDQHLLEDIFRRYLKNECSAQEISFLLDHFKTAKNEDTLRSIISQLLNDHPLAEAGQAPHIQTVLDRSFENILNRITTAETFEPNEMEDGEEKEPRSNRPLLLRFLAGLVLAGIVFQVLFVHQKEKTITTVANIKPHRTKIKPGGNKATLTLQDGSTIVLDDAKNGTVAQQGGANVVKMANGQLVYSGGGDAQKVMFNTMSTPRGGQYKLTLPDGTGVWLNSASSITYPTAFVGKERSVSISGEAYFEVAKDKTKPFFVKTGNQNIEVLGTHFNVMAYADEKAIKTTLIEGSVKISESGHTEILKPGEQAINENGQLSVGPAAIDEALAWKNGYFKFSRVDIKYIMRQLSRWYDVEVVYDGPVKNDEFVGTISRDENIVQALHLLELTNVHFKIKDNMIIVLPY